MLWAHIEGRTDDQEMAIAGPIGGHIQHEALKIYTQLRIYASLVFDVRFGCAAYKNQWVDIYGFSRELQHLP